MKQVSRSNLSTPDAVSRKVRELCDATQEPGAEQIADAYTVTVPSTFTPVRTLTIDANGNVQTDLGALVATFLMDLQQRGAGRRTSSV